MPASAASGFAAATKICRGGSGAAWRGVVVQAAAAAAAARQNNLRIGFMLGPLSLVFGWQCALANAPARVHGPIGHGAAAAIG
jgi:hypothetical protein